MRTVYDGKLKLLEELGAEEMLDFLLILQFGATKYEPKNWLKLNGTKSDEKSMHDSMFHHLAQSASFQQSVPRARTAKDPESGYDPLLHLACRALMLYTRRKRGLSYTNEEE